MRVLLIALVVLMSSCGKQGENGADGQLGAPGKGCTETPVKATGIINDPFIYGGVLITCENGTTALINGAPGPLGPIGPAGPKGTDATPVTVVQLCTQYSTVYPSSFPEQAFCLNNTLYAVYWTGSQAFLAEIAPGYYASTSPQGCSFTVRAGCLVTQ